LTPAISTESAAVNTDIAIVNVLVVDPVGFLTVKSLSHHVSQKTEGEKIIGLKQSQPIIPGETMVGHDFVVYVSELTFLHPALSGGRRKTLFNFGTWWEHALFLSQT
jgi:hypothetical protein